MASPCPRCGSTEGPDHPCGAAQKALIGQVLDGRYRIEEVIGQGGMGMVFRATQTSVQRPVAVKTLHPALAAAPQFFERFRREAEIASRLRHPNVITIYDFGRAQDGTCYYVMELLEGESLREIVKREGPMSLRRAVDVMEQACRGLAHAHEQGAIHRDIKPHNLMVQQLDGRDFVKVLDFGLVKALEHEEGEQQLTSTGQVLGTPQYMSPEQAGGEDVDHRSDLYSMGGVFYYCLTGTSPYGATTVRKALSAALTQPVPTVTARRQGAPVPRELEDFFKKALARETEDRFQSAQEFIEAMLDAVENLPAEELDARPSGPVPEVSTGSKPGQRSVSRPGRSSSNAARSHSSAVAARGSSQPSAARGGPPSGSGRVSHGSGSAGRHRMPPPEAPVPQHTQPIQDPPRGSALGIKIALVMVPLLLLASAVAFVARRPSTRAEAPPSVTAEKGEPPPARGIAAPAVNGMILVQLRSAPSGAAVFDRDVQIGTTPLDRRLRRDEVHELTFRLAQHQDVKRKLDFSGVLADTQEVHVTMKPVKTALPEPSRAPLPPLPPAQQAPDDSVPIFD